MNKLNKYAHFIFTLPGLVLYSIFFVFPLLSGVYYSLTDWNGVSKKFHFIGISNFIKIFRDRRVLHSLSFTLNYVVFSVVLVTVISLGIALLLNTRFRGNSIKFKIFFRSVYFYPAVLSLITVGLVFNQLFQSMVPAFGELIHSEALSTNMLANIKLAPVGILIVTVWQKIALPIVLFIAGLQSVPESLIEAARIDGANKIQIFLKIVFPFLIPVFNIVVIFTLKDALTVFGYILAMTEGGPAGATESLGYLIYWFCFRGLKFSYGVTLAIVLGFTIAVISLIQIKFLSRLEIEG